MSSIYRRPVFFNPTAASWTAPPATSAADVDNFHRQLPSYQATPLISLPDIAKELKVGAVYLKDETQRFDLPSFKILGASWGTFRAIAQRLGLPLDTDLETLKAEAASHEIKLYAATDGNHGRAVARMGVLLSAQVEIFVPVNMDIETIELINSENAVVAVSQGTYDEAVLEAQAAAAQTGGLFIQDFAFGDYTEIPQWIVDGYLTMMRETTSQLPSPADLVIAPVGVGSFAQAVVSHFKQPGSKTKVLTVEPDTAACLWKSLESGELSVERTTSTIMAGLNCGTPSTIAWPILEQGVDASITVSDFEAHEASSYLSSCGVEAGPCGAAPLAALRRMTEKVKSCLGINEDSVIVLFCTEGARSYTIPMSVSSDDPVVLTQSLVQIDSSNPNLGTIPGPGETDVAEYIAAWLEHRNIETHWIEPVQGRPSIVGVVRGSGGGKSLMLNGHIDTVTLTGYEDDPLSGKIEDGKLYGRGAADMKGGIAAAMVALVNTKMLDLRGDVIFTGVADEENISMGTEQVLEAGWRADAAIVNEPTDLEIVHAHKGFVWLEVNVHGVASHGSRADLGIDAIAKAGYFLVELDKYSQRLQERASETQTEAPSVHASIITGGEELSSYPARCTISLEYRTVASQTAESVQQEMHEMLQKLANEVPGFQSDLVTTFDRPPYELPLSDPFAALVTEIVGRSLEGEATVNRAQYWTDCALLANEGIPSLLWGPRGEGLHAKEEWVDVNSVKQVANALTEIAARFCR